MMEDSFEVISKSKEDMLSNLPDEIIHHILSSVDAASAVQTCVLGKEVPLEFTKFSTFDIATLEQLYLFNCRFDDDVEEEPFEPFKGCVNLTCLFIRYCHYYGRFAKFKIFAPHLTDLEILWTAVDGGFYLGCVIELFTPKLQSFTYHEYDLYDFSIKGKLPCAEKVNINVGYITHTSFRLRLIQLFGVMENAKFVTLSADIIEVLSMFPDLLDGRASPFTKVQAFELNMNRQYYSFVMPANVMAYLFGGSPGFDFSVWKGRVLNNLLEDGFSLTFAVLTKN